MVAPEESVIWPVMVAVSDCAIARRVAPKARQSRIEDRAKNRLRIGRIRGITSKSESLSINVDYHVPGMPAREAKFINKAKI